MKSLLVCLFLPVLAFAQKPGVPQWAHNHEQFLFAKIKQFNSATKSFGPETYKDCSIVFEDATDNLIMTVTVDLPDRFYLKLATVSEIQYQLMSSKTESFQYIAISGDKSVAVTLYYDNAEVSDDNPVRALISFTEGKGGKIISYMLSELK
jgi:hypothetical protein